MNRQPPPELRPLIEAATKARQQGRLEEALRLYRQVRAGARARNLHKMECDQLYEMAMALEDAGHLSEGLSILLELQTLAHTYQLVNMESTALVRQGRVYTALGQIARAQGAVQEGLRLQRTIVDKVAEGERLIDCGFAYLSLGEAQEALVCLEQSERVSSEIHHEPMATMARAYQAYVYRKTNRFQKALELFLLVYQEHQKESNHGHEVADLREIAVLYLVQGEATRALLYFQAALRLAAQYGDRAEAAGILEYISELYANQGKYQTALQYRLRALHIHKERGDLRGQAWVLGLIGVLWAHLGQEAKALAALTEARHLTQVSQQAVAEIGVLELFAKSYRELGQLHKTREWYEKALVQQKRVGIDHWREGEYLEQLGAVCLKLRQTAPARQYTQQALTLFRLLGDRLWEAVALALLGDVERLAGQPRAAEGAYRQGIAIAEALRVDAGSGMSVQGALLEKLSDSYVGYLTLLVEQGRASEAFVLAQKIKARGLLDLMAGGKVDLSGQLTESERAEEQRKRTACDLLSAAMVREAALNVPGSKKRFEAVKADLAQAERELSVFQDSLYAKYPGLGQRRAASLVSLSQIAKALPRTAALLEYAPLEKGRVVLFVVTPDGRVTVHRVEKALSGQIASLRSACTDPKKPWTMVAQRLHRALLGSAEERLSGKTQLIVCPDRALWDVPFAVLVDKHGEPLLSRFSLSYASSATAWHAAQSLSRRPVASPKLLVLANPQFDVTKRFESGSVVPGQRPITVPDRPITVPDRPITVPDRPITVPDRDLLLPRGTRLVDLPGTQREADALAKRFPSATVLTRAKAQESTIKKEIGKFQRLHIASHAFVNDAAPLLSSIVLANPTVGSGEDGFLTAREIFDLDLSGVELVVLSACNTARGKTQGGEGVIGLTWALFAAGCPTQVLSQWAVDDSSTATLMTRFYEGLAKGVAKSEALRRAALAVRKESKYAHPYFWAPFVLIGNQR